MAGGTGNKDGEWEIDMKTSQKMGNEVTESTRGKMTFIFPFFIFPFTMFLACSNTEVT